MKRVLDRRARLRIIVGMGACLLAGGGPLVALGTCLIALGPGDTAAVRPAVEVSLDGLPAVFAAPSGAAGRCDDARRSPGDPTEQGQASDPACEADREGVAPAADGASTTATR